MLARVIRHGSALKFSSQGHRIVDQGLLLPLSGRSSRQWTSSIPAVGILGQLSAYLDCSERLNRIIQRSTTRSSAKRSKGNQQRQSEQDFRSRMEKEFKNVEQLTEHKELELIHRDIQWSKHVMPRGHVQSRPDVVLGLNVEFYRRLFPRVFANNKSLPCAFENYRILFANATLELKRRTGNWSGAGNQVDNNAGIALLGCVPALMKAGLPLKWKRLCHVAVKMKPNNAEGYCYTLNSLTDMDCRHIGKWNLRKDLHAMVTIVEEEIRRGLLNNHKVFMDAFTKLEKEREASSPAGIQFPYVSGSSGVTGPVASIDA